MCRVGAEAAPPLQERVDRLRSPGALKGSRVTEEEPEIDIK